MKKLMMLISIFFGLVLTMSANSSPPTDMKVGSEEVNATVNDLNTELMVLSRMNFEGTNLLTAVSPSCLNQDLIMSSANVELERTITALTNEDATFCSTRAEYISAQNSTTTCTEDTAMRPDEIRLVLKKPISSIFMCEVNQYHGSDLNNLNSPPGYQVLLE
jgi:hypothetical protein